MEAQKEIEIETATREAPENAMLKRKRKKRKQEVRHG